jgi:heme o synthase
VSPAGLSARQAIDGEAAPAPVELPPARRLSFLELTKPRLNLLVLITTLAGYYLGSTGGEGIARLLWALGGTALVAAGASALNQWMERDAEARMIRTRGRPLPSERLHPREVLWFGLSLMVVGVALLAATVNLLTAGLAALTGLAYLVLYTPMKRWTPLNTLAGAVPGAIPPVMGWTAARGSLGPEALALFSILFFWQLPHFLAIAWLYREDYARAGFRMLPLERDGAGRTGLAAVIYAAALVGASVLPFLLGTAGAVYLVGALALSLGFLAAAGWMASRCDDRSARILFRSSLVFLPLLFALMALDKVSA